ncbi:MAG: DNA polymerase III subunit delta' [Clostridia bacterium]|nr:DNA polymerase III subunit delta' [Clostridia bacterium]
MFKINAQDRAVDFLKKTIEEKSLSHFYLFYGPPGVGKMTAALAFAAGLLCEAPENYEACGKCANCRRVLHANCPNIITIKPDGKVIKIDQIRELQSYLKFKMEQGESRFFIIDDAHKMTREAANSLLKVLEEPPGGTFFILISDNIDLMPATVVSRGQLIKFNPVPRSVIDEILREKGCSKEKAAAVSLVSRGSVGNALTLMEDEEVVAQRENIIAFLAHLPTRRAKILEFAAELDANYDVPLGLDIVFSCYRDLLVWQATGKDKMIINQDFIDGIRKRVFCPGTLLKKLDDIIYAQRAISNNANRLLTLETLLLNLNDQSS